MHTLYTGARPSCERLTGQCFPQVRRSVVDTRAEDCIPASGRQGYAKGAFPVADFASCEKIAASCGWHFIVERLFRDSRDAQGNEDLAEAVCLRDETPAVCRTGTDRPRPLRRFPSVAFWPPLPHLHRPTMMPSSTRYHPVRLRLAGAGTSADKSQLTGSLRVSFLSHAGSILSAFPLRAGLPPSLKKQFLSVDKGGPTLSTTG
jgi:hypothetical protein